MLNRFSRGKYGPIGLDLGAETIRMLQLDCSGPRLRLAGAGRWRFPSHAMESGADPQERRQLASQAVREMLKKGGFHGKHVVSCIKANDLAIRNIRVPQMSDEELSSAVLWESQERFGFEVSRDRVFYVKAGEVRQGTESRDEVILMVVAEDKLRDHLETLREMRLKPVHVDAEPSALLRTYQRFLRRAEDEGAVLVIADIGLEATKVVVARGATIVLVKSIDVAGHTFNQSVAKELGLSYSEAQHLRRRAFEDHPGDMAGQVPEDRDQVQWSLFDAIRGQVEGLAREISLCLRYCSVTFRGLRPAQITLTGGEAYDPALVKLLGDCLDCECEVGQPLRGIDLGEANLGADRRGVLTEWSLALGLALRGVTTKRDTRKADHERRRIPA